LQIKECTLKTAVLSSIEDKKVINYLWTYSRVQLDVLNKDIAFAVIKLLEGVTEGGSQD
jgi:penicillin-binding protein 1A